MINDESLAGGVRRQPRNKGESVNPSHVTTLGWLILALVVCLTLGAIHLGKASLWSDEVFPRYYYDVFGLHFMVTDGLRVEPTPPTYAIALEGWMVLFGDSEAALRSLSVVVYAACLPIVFLLSRELGSRREALLAAFLFALCPTGLYYAQEARTYAMTLLPVCLVLFACASFLREPTSRWAYATYIFGGTLCVYLHATMVFVLASSALAVTACLVAQRRAGFQHMLLRWVGLNATVLVLGLPYLASLRAASQSGGLDWIPPFGLHDIAVWTASLVSGVVIPYPWPAFGIAAICVFVLAISVLVHHPDQRTFLVLIAIPGLFLGLVIMVSVIRPILLPRVLCWMIIPLCAVAARQMLRPGRLRYAVIGAWTVAFAGGLTAQEITPNVGKEPWRDVFASLSPQLMHSGLIVLSPRFDPLILKYYAPQLSRLRIWDERLPPTIMTTAVKQMGIALISRQQIMQEITEGRTVWVLSNSVDIPYVTALQAALPPQQTRTWQCGRRPCIAAAGWAVGNGANTQRAVIVNKSKAG